MEGQCLSQDYFGCKEQKPVSSGKSWETAEDKMDHLAELTNIQVSCRLHLAGQEGRPSLHLWWISQSVLPHLLGRPPVPSGHPLSYSCSFVPEVFTKCLVMCVFVPQAGFHVPRGRLRRGGYGLHQACLLRGGTDRPLCMRRDAVDTAEQVRSAGARPELGAVM